MAKQKEDFGLFKPFFPLYQKNGASEKQNIRCYWNLENFDQKKQRINYDFPTVIHKIAKTWFRDKVAIFQNFVWFCLLGPRLSSLDTPPLKAGLSILIADLHLNMYNILIYRVILCQKSRLQN